MNTVTLWGRLARDPVIKWVELKDSQEKMCIARSTDHLVTKTKTIHKLLILFHA